MSRPNSKDQPTLDETAPADLTASGDALATATATANAVAANEEPAFTFDDSPAIKDDVFTQMMSEFQQTLDTLSTDPVLQPFKEDYQKLLQTLVQSRDNEHKLISRLHEASTEIQGSTVKIQTAMKTSHTDRITIANLKKEVKKVWQMVEEANERETKSKESTQQLKLEISELQQILQRTANAGAGQERSVNDLIRQKEELTKERDMQMNQIVQLRSEITDLVEKTKGLETEKFEIQNEIQQLRDMLINKKAEADREMRNRDKLERELKEARQMIDLKNTEIRGKQESMSRAKEDISRLEAVIKEQKNQLEKITKEQEHLSTKSAKLQQDYEEQLMNTTQLLAENQAKTAELKSRESDIARMKDDMRNISRIKESLTKKIKQLEEDKHKVETERDELKTVSHAYEKDLETFKKQTETDRRQLDELSRERDLINRSLQKSTSNSQKQANLVKIHEQQKRNLEQDISLYKDEASKQRKIIYQLERERDRYINEAGQVQTQLMQSYETVKEKEIEIIDYKKNISELETKLKQQQNLYEAVRSDRNLFNKNLIEAQEEINEMRRKLKIMNHQIEQLKEEISSKETALVKEHFDLVKVEKEKESLKNEIQRLKQQCDMAQQYIQSRQVEEQKLRAIAAEAEAERQRQKKEYDTVVQERDILGAQLVRRNDELALLYEKIKIQASTLAKGEGQYRERVEDIRILKLEIKRLRRERALLQNETAGNEQLKSEIVKLQRDILREKSRVKVLEEELQNPVNIHRWRKLEGTDPATFELIQKVQTLQRRLIQKTEEVVEKELMIQQKEKMYGELKTILARQPGPEVLEQINAYQLAIKEKTTQLKAMASELNMYQAQVAEYKYEIERLQKEMLSLKKRYFEQKKKSMQLDSPRTNAGSPVPFISVPSSKQQHPQEHVDKLREVVEQLTHSQVPAAGAS